MNPKELIAAYLDGSLDPRQRTRLTEWLREDAANVRLFTEAARFEQQLRETVQSREAGTEAEPSRAIEKKSTHPRRKPWLAMAACLTMTGVLTWVFLRPATPLPSAAATWIAEVITLRGEPNEGEAPWNSGQKLEPGSVTLSVGAMELKFINGVHLVLEAPSELDLRSPMHVVLRSGQAVVRVSEQAKGFRLETSGAQVVDLGTEFGVKCGPGGVTDVQVFAGEVVASSALDRAGFPHHLTSGMATRFSPGQPQPAKIAYGPERFVRRLPVDQGQESQQKHFSFNAPTIEEATVLPVGQPILLDGDLSEWENAGHFRMECSPSEYVAGRMRYDADFLYVAAHLGDPAPMRNVVDPATDAEFGWRGGGLQIRVAADPALGWPVNANAADYYELRHLPVDAVQMAQARNPAIAHLTLWHHAPTTKACLHIAYGMDFHGHTVNPPGYQAGFRKDANGLGYTLEYAIPWKLLGVPRGPQPNATLGMTWTAHWSDESGRLWRGQWADLRNLSEPVRIHTWERAATWGRAIFQ